MPERLREVIQRSDGSVEDRRLAELTCILGCPRSGTTFLLEALRPAPGLQAVSGLIFPVPVIHLAATASGADRRLIELSFRTSMEDFAEYVSHTRTWALGEFARGGLSVAEFVQAATRARPRISVLYKEPFLAFAPDLPHAALPGTRTIHIYRDGRDCADSLQRKYGVLSDAALSRLTTYEAPAGRRIGDRHVPWWLPEGEEDDFIRATPFVRSVWMWREMVRRCETFFSHPDVRGSGRVLEIRYEQLVEDPGEISGQLERHLGIPLNRRTRKRLAGGHVKSVGVHRRLGDAEIAAANDVAGAELRRLGYPT